MRQAHDIARNLCQFVSYISEIVYTCSNYWYILHGETGTIPELQSSGASMKSSIIALLALLTFSSSPSTFAQLSDRTSVWESLRVTDAAFAERSRTLGMNRAFLDAFGEGAVLFRRGPVDARLLYEQVSPEDRLNSTLESKANYIDFSRAGDLGLTSGPYRYTVGFGEEQRRSYGHFVTIWRKFDGEWRMVADMVVRVPGVLSLDVEPDIRETHQLFAETALASEAINNTVESLIEADERLIASINFRGGRRAATRFGIEHQRIFVPGMAPGIGNESASIVFGTYMDEQMALSLLESEPAGAFLAESGEAGYTFGTMSVEGAGFNTNYLRYWHYTTAGEWKVAVEVLSPY